MKTKYLWSVVVVMAVLAVNGSWLYAADMDDRIESSIKNSYVFKTQLKDDSIKIESKDGNVTLSGTVAEDSHKDMAADVAEDTPGVKRVENKLESKAEKQAEQSDGWISTKVKAILLFHRNVSGTKTKVAVKDGVVTLSGEADSMAQKELTTEYARDVAGVKDVKNEMTVAKPEKKNDRTMGDKVDDSSITVQIKWALLTHRSTSALRTKVSTKEGIVTITGTAKNSAEKDLVTKIAQDIHGVKEVKNNMTVEESAAN